MTEMNPIVRLSNQRGGLNPEAVETLSLEFTSPLYHLDHQLRHPYGIYNVSLNQVLSSFGNLLTELASKELNDPRSNKSNPKWDDSLLHSLEKLLYALMEHMDDCENIIRCFFPAGTKLNREVSFRAYQCAVGQYRTHIGKVVNYLKHHQGRLRSFGMIVDDIRHLGYFVEGMSEDGSLGPALNIHSKGLTAFSFARDIRLHLYNLYYVSRKLSEVVEAVSAHDTNRVVYPIEEKNADLEKILCGIARLPMVVFPDELQKDFPHIALEYAQEIVRLTLSIQRHPHELRTATSPARFFVSCMGDGVSRSFRMPYGGKWW